jgi:hypothetical protein
VRQQDAPLGISLKQHFETQREYLNYFFDRLDYAQAENVVEKMLACQGTIVFVGNKHIKKHLSSFSRQDLLNNNKKVLERVVLSERN